MPTFIIKCVCTFRRCPYRRIRYLDELKKKKTSLFNPEFMEFNRFPSAEVLKVCKHAFMLLPEKKTF